MARTTKKADKLILKLRPNLDLTDKYASLFSAISAHVTKYTDGGLLEDSQPPEFFERSVVEQKKKNSRRRNPKKK